MTNENSNNNAILYAAYILAGLTLVFFISWHLVPALLAGLFIHELVHQSAGKIQYYTTLQRRTAKVVIISLIAILVVTVLAIALAYLVNFFRYGSENLPALLKKMAEALESSKQSLPDWLAKIIPQDVTAVKNYIVDWLRNHAAEVTAITKSTLRALAHILVGMIIGAMIALYEIQASAPLKPFGRALAGRAYNLSISFRQIVRASKNRRNQYRVYWYLSCHLVAHVWS